MRHSMRQDSPGEDGNCAQQNLESAAGKDLKTASASASCPLISAPADPGEGLIHALLRARGVRQVGSDVGSDGGTPSPLGLPTSVMGSLW